tara:strand:+ start:4191 stop:5132 length:942 start_codon:yes stop_codon:yes gene_type:complete
MKICLIGSCDLMIDCIKILKKKKIDLLVILSERHSKSKIVNYKEFPQNILKKLKIKYVISKNINKDIKAKKILKCFNADYGFCFGSAWIFNFEILSMFKNYQLNFNPTPIPKFFGGAHYTWQILNKNLDSGLFIQEITKNVDRGEIIYIKKMKIKKKLTKPKDYFQYNYRFQKNVLKKFLTKFLTNKSFKKIPMSKFDSEREYLPKLNTIKDGFIDWNWHGKDIKTFCDAFDQPYPGAQTIIGKKQVGLQTVAFVRKKNIHPFMFGILFRKSQKSIYVFCKGGYLIIKRIINKNKKDINFDNFKEGQKLISKK